MNKRSLLYPAVTLLAVLATAAIPSFAAGAEQDKETTKKADKPSTISIELKKGEPKKDDTPSRQAVVITLTGPVPERSEALSLFASKQQSLKQYQDLLRRARQDPDVRTVILRISAASIGLATTQELRDAIAEVRAANKKVIAVLDDESQSGYLVACSADEIVMPPSGGIMFHGVKADGYFLKGLLGKLGAEAHIVHMGKYKAAGEVLTEDDFTTPARENMEEIVGDVYAQMVDTIAETRKLSTATVVQLIDRGPMTAAEAKEAGLVDRVEYSSEVSAGLRKEGFRVAESGDYFKSEGPRMDELNLFSLLSTMSKPPSSRGSASSKFPKVAIVYATGPIIPGSSSSLFGGDTEIAADDLVATLDEILQDDTIKAVILRVESPGGSAFASDLIWRKVGDLRGKKPVVVSMGNVAASGGYYISMAASKIIAQPGTLTGSIGVVGGKADLSGTYGKLGITKTTVSRGANANLFSETGGFTPHDRAIVERLMKNIYDDFVHKAAEGREMSVERLDEVAQGKVWLGERAKAVGLVDEVGGLPLAVDTTKELIGIKKDDKIELVSYPKELTIMDLFEKAFGGGATARSPGLGMMVQDMLPATLQPLLTQTRTVLMLLQRERVLAVMPFVPVLN